VEDLATANILQIAMADARPRSRGGWGQVVWADQGLARTPLVVWPDRPHPCFCVRECAARRPCITEDSRARSGESSSARQEKALAQARSVLVVLKQTGLAPASMYSRRSRER
jgi:hypothetical protein